MFLSVIWIQELNAPLAILLMILIWEVAGGRRGLAADRGMLAHWTAINSLTFMEDECQVLHRVEQRQAQTGIQVAGEQLSRKGPGGAGGSRLSESQQLPRQPGGQVALGVH